MLVHTDMVRNEVQLVVEWEALGASSDTGAGACGRAREVRAMAMGLVGIGEELGGSLPSAKAVESSTLGAGCLSTLSLEVLPILLPHVEVEVTVEGSSLEGSGFEDLLVWCEDLLGP